jgi:hypothetical protein
VIIDVFDPSKIEFYKSQFEYYHSNLNTSTEGRISNTVSYLMNMYWCYWVRATEIKK